MDCPQKCDMESGRLAIRTRRSMWRLTRVRQPRPLIAALTPLRTPWAGVLFQS